MVKRTYRERGSISEEEQCLPIEAESKGPGREVEDLEEAKASGARGSGDSWMAMEEQAALSQDGEGKRRPDEDCFLNRLLLQSFGFL